MRAIDIWYDWSGNGNHAFRGLPTKSIRYKDGRAYNLGYVRVYIPATFEKRYVRKKGEGWWCPVGSCSCRGRK